MKKITFLFYTLFLLFCTSSISAQKLIFDKEIFLRKGLGDRRNVHAFWNQKSNEIALFSSDGKNCFFQLLDQNYQLLSDISSSDKNKAHNKIEGVSYKDGKYYLYMSNKYRSELLINEYNPQTTQINSKKLRLKQSFENFIQNFNYDGKMYCLSLIRGSSIIAVRVYQGFKEIKTHLIDMSKQLSNTNLSILLGASVKMNFPVRIERIENSMANSLETCSALKKIYFKDNEVIITINKKRSLTTHIVNIDLEQLNGNISIVKNSVDNVTARFRYNTFYLNGILYQLLVDKTMLNLSAYDFKKNKELKNYCVLRNETLHFKNSEIIQKGGGVFLEIDEKVLKTTNQLIRKMLSSNIAVNAHLQGKDNVQLCFGAFEKKEGSPPMMMYGMPGMGINSGVVGSSGSFSVTAHYNPMYAAYSYKSSKAVEVKSIFDLHTFEHQTGKIKRSFIDVLNSFTDEFYDMQQKYGTITMNIQSLIKKEDKYLFVYYTPKNEELRLHVFDNF